MMEIKKATPKDLPEILEVMKIGTTADHTAFIRRSVRGGQCRVALVEGKIAGLAVLGASLFFGQEFMELLIVHPAHRRRGVATALIRKLVSLCKTGKFFTSTNQSNIPAQKTFEANGLIRSGYIENLNLDEGDPEIIYFKRLKGK